MYAVVFDTVPRRMLKPPLISVGGMPHDFNWDSIAATSSLFHLAERQP